MFEIDSSCAVFMHTVKRRRDRDAALTARRRRLVRRAKAAHVRLLDQRDGMRTRRGTLPLAGEASTAESEETRRRLNSGWPSQLFNASTGPGLHRRRRPYSPRAPLACGLGVPSEAFSI